MYREDELLPLSAIQHMSFCPRQFMLIHVEHCWSENLQTAQGRSLHEKAHDPYINEKRGTLIISRAMPIVSYSLGLIGEADVVEFHSCEGGITLSGRKGRWLPEPVEYKRGRPKKEEHDQVQLCAQAICLEEMLKVKISEASLFYWEVRSREKVLLDEKLRAHTMELAEKMHELYSKKISPRAGLSKAKCKLCSLNSECLPALKNSQGVRAYIDCAFKDVE